MKKQKTVIILFSLIFFGSFFAQALFSHCQVPCGIYDDQMRFKMISEHITTIEKAMNQIISLSKEGNTNYNQIVRWVLNKEKHAEEISQILHYYFLAQRVKPVDPKDTKKRADYQKKLEIIHKLIFYGMKAKQSTDPAHIKKLRSLLDEFNHLYFSKK